MILHLQTSSGKCLIISVMGGLLDCALRVGGVYNIIVIVEYTVHPWKCTDKEHWTSICYQKAQK